MSAPVSRGNDIQTKLLWAAIVALGAVSFGIVALTRGESVNAAWLVVAAVCIYFIACRFYALFVANKTYVRHRQTFHPEQAIMSCEEFFRERRDARYAVGRGRFRVCC